jgi:ribosome-binding protein aMBF1 (putative translation factor)
VDNLSIFNQVKNVPPEAQRVITGGRLTGFTEINPMWRIEKLTEIFGPAGFGWYYEITEKRIEEGAEGEKTVFVDINLYVKQGNEWSKPIQGTGGSMLVAKEKGGMYTSDECFKMALTDAISVACKALGFGADIYAKKDRSKYNGWQPQDNRKQQSNKDQVTEAQKQAIRTQIKKLGMKEEVLLQSIKAKSLDSLTKQQASDLITKLDMQLKKGA